MQGTVGHWCAIAILGVAAAYGLISYFNQTTSYQQMEASLVQATPQELAQRGNTAIQKLLQERGKLQEETNDLKMNRLVEKENKVTSLTSELSTEKERTKSVQLKFDEQKFANNNLKKELEETRKILAKAGSESDQERRDKEDLKRKIDEISSQLDEVVRDKKSLQSNEKVLTESAQKRIQSLQREKAQLLEAINKKTEAIRNRSSTKRDEADGAILSLDIPTRFCVIDLGRINGVHRGMRFDVMRSRQNKMVRLATIEVTKVGSSTSEAAILNEPSIKKVCPVTGYVAPNPEERYSPYAVGDGDRAIPLATVVQEDVCTMKESDPVVVGDIIVNPVFEKDKKLKIAFAGDPVIYPIDVLKNQIQEAGAQLQDKVDIDTDFLVIGRLDEAKINAIGGEKDAAEKDPKLEEYRKTLDIASQYGIPVIREVELYDYLRN